MQKKRVFAVFLILSLAILASSVAAQDAGSPFSSMWEMIKGILSPFFNVDIGTAEPVTLKILLALLIFPLLGYAASMAFKSQPKIGWIAAALLTIITVMAIPAQVIRGIAYTYSTVIVFILAAVPVLGLFLLLSAIKKMAGEHRVFYHVASIVVILLVLVVLNQVVRAFGSSSEFMSNLQWQGISKLPGFAIGVLTLMLLYHFFALLFGGLARHGPGAAGAVKGWFGGGGGGLPSTGPAPLGGGKRWFKPWTWRRKPEGPAGEGEEEALKATEAAVVQETAAEEKEVETVKQGGLLAEERMKLTQSLAQLDLKNLADAQKINSSLAELEKLAQVYKGNPEALAMIQARLNDIQPPETEMKANLEEMKKRLAELQKSGEAQAQLYLTKQQAEMGAKELLARENIRGLRNYLAKSAIPELQAAGVDLERLQTAKENLIKAVIASSEKNVANFQATYKRNYDLLAGNVGVIDGAQGRFIAALQAYVNAIKEGVQTGTDRTQDAVRAIGEARAAFGQMASALQKNEEYERDIQTALQYESQYDAWVERVENSVMNINKTKLLPLIEKARQKAQAQGAQVQAAAANIQAPS